MWLKALAWLKQWGLALGLFLVTILTLGGYALKQKKRGDQLEGKLAVEKTQRAAERTEVAATHAAQLAELQAEKQRAVTEATKKAEAQTHYDEQIKAANEDAAKAELADKQGNLDLELNRRIDEGTL